MTRSATADIASMARRSTGGYLRDLFVCASRRQTTKIIGNTSKLEFCDFFAVVTNKYLVSFESESELEKS